MICIHQSKFPDIICKACHITSTPSWAAAKQHKLQTSVRHSSDPLYLNFLNIIRHRPPTETKIEDTLNTCFIDNDMLSHYPNPTTTILYSHRKYVTTYNDCIFKAIFAPTYIIPVTLDTNATEAHNFGTWKYRNGWKTLNLTNFIMWLWVCSLCSHQMSMLQKALLTVQPLW